MTLAKRYNTGKPQLSYILEFSKSLGMVADISTHNSDINESDDLISLFMINRDNLTNNCIAEIIAFNILPQLENMLSIVNPGEFGLGASLDLYDPITQSTVLYHQSINELCRICENGAIKYDRGNWKQGFKNVYVLIDCVFRHYRKHAGGQYTDMPDEVMINRWESGDSELLAMFNNDFNAFSKQFQTYHLAHVLWNLLAIIELGLLD